MIANIKREKYLEFARQLTPEESALIQGFATWLPKQIIDVHAHCNLPDHVLSVDAQAFGHMLSTFPSFTLEESAALNQLLHPGINIRTLRFPQVFRGIDHVEANQYLLQFSPLEDRIALFGLHHDPDYTIRILKNHPRITALKMYHSYPDPPAQHIYEFFTPEILAVAESCEIPIVLHPPKPIALCLDQVLQVMEDFPNLKICLAHVGLTAHYSQEFEQAVQTLNQFENIYYDTSMIPDAKVIATVIRITNGEKIMYGSDAPLHVIRAKEYKHPEKGMRLATPYPYHWVDSQEYQEYSHLAAKSPHIHWHALNAVKQAIQSFPHEQQESLKDRIFRLNATCFYNF